MERQNGSLSPQKKVEIGVRGKPPYSVETPYGFQLDLDFLKYVDDIEKGNTIKKVPITRRSKGPRASTLPRNLNNYGCFYRSTPWGSTGALSLMSRLSDGPYHGCNSWTNDHKPLSPTRMATLAELEARIKEFDEQPLGEHIRPHLLRASSLPLTVLLRQGSESTDDQSSLHSSRDHLGGRNPSCEDVFLSQDSPHPQDCTGLLRRLNEALERVGELEMEVRVIPQLKSQIRLLQEEREQLQLGLNPHSQSYPVNGGMNCSYSKGDVKRPRHESHIVYPKNHTQTDSLHEWRSSTDLDELLTVTSLQAKVAVLEQKLHETSLELQRMRDLLKEQQEESRRKDRRIEQLLNKPGEWVHAERVVVDQNGEETVVRAFEPEYNTVSSFICRSVNSLGQKQQDSAVSSTTKEKKEHTPADTSENDLDTALAVYHIKKIKSLLEQQWECLCAESHSVKNHQSSKVKGLQQEMMELVDILASFYRQHGAEPEGSGGPEMSNSLHGQCGNDGCSGSGSLFGKVGVRQDKHADLEQKEISCDSKETTPVQVDVEPENRVMVEGKRQTCLPSKTTLADIRSGNTTSEEAVSTGNKMKTKSQVRGTVMEGNSEPATRNRETVSADFIAACCFLKDHMNDMDNPNDDTRRALMVLFQHWFSMAAEEASVSHRVSLHLKEVKKAAPSLLAFLVNLADDNGNTALHYSVSHCNYDIVSLLLDTGVSDVNSQNHAGYTAVMLASLTAPDGPCGMEVVRRLMELGNIHICSTKTGQTALHLAVRHGRVVMVRLLLSFGADTNIQDAEGSTPLMFASERGHTHIARLLLERGQCDLMLTNKRGQTALSIAMQRSHTDTVSLLQAHAKARAL